MRRLMSFQARISSSPSLVRRRSASRRLTGRRSSTACTVSQIQATITFV